MQQYQKNELRLLQEYFDLFQACPEALSFKNIHLTTTGPGMRANEKRAFQSLASAGLVTIGPSEHRDGTSTEHATLSSEGANEVVRLFREGALKKK